MRNDREGERVSGEGGAVELLGELFGMFKGGEMPEQAPLMTFWNGSKGRCGRGDRRHTVSGAE